MAAELVVTALPHVSLPVNVSVPPLLTLITGMALDDARGAIARVPALIVVVPVNEFAALSVSVPEPVFVSVAVPETIPERVPEPVPTLTASALLLAMAPDPETAPLAEANSNEPVLPVCDTELPTDTPELP